MSPNKETEKVKSDSENILDMDSVDEETGYFDVEEDRHKKFDRVDDTEEYRNLVESMMGLCYDP